MRPGGVPSRISRSNAPAFRISLRLPRRRASANPAACAVAISSAPHLRASSSAAASAASPISSTASSCGAHDRINIGRASAFGQPSITSVRGPTSICGDPSQQAAISQRSSATATFQPDSDAIRIRSRSRVVLPMPGGERINALDSPLPYRKPASFSPQPFTSRGMRMHSELISDML